MDDHRYMQPPCGLIMKSQETYKSGLDNEGKAIVVPVVAFRGATGSRLSGWGWRQPGCIPPSTTTSAKSASSEGRPGVLP